MELIVPRSFKLLNRNYKVTRPKAIVVDNVELNGYCASDTATISIEKGLDKDLADETFLHEMTHAILFALGYDELSYDEKFVGSFSAALHQVLKTAK